VSAEENKALVCRFLEAQAKCDLEILDALLAPDFVDRSLLPGQEPDREAYKREVAEDHAALSDLRYVIEDQLTDGDKVVSRVTVHLVHDRREYDGVAPTGRKYEVPNILIHRIEGTRSRRNGAKGAASQS
jgi:predicted ester cyclase